MSIALDDIDHNVLDLLRANARASLAEIGQRVGLSSPAVKRRIDKLEELGVITGYTVLVDDAKLGNVLEAFTEVRFRGNTEVADIGGIARGLSEVRTVFTTAGDPDALVHLRARDVRHLTQLINCLRRYPGVTGTKTLMVLDTWTP